MFCSGFNAYGQLLCPRSSSSSATGFTKSPAVNGPVKSVAATANCTYVLLQNGTLFSSSLLMSSSSQQDSDKRKVDCSLQPLLLHTDLSSRESRQNITQLAATPTDLFILTSKALYRQLPPLPPPTEKKAELEGQGPAVPYPSPSMLSFVKATLPSPLVTPDEHLIQVSCGTTFLLCLSSAGRVFSAGLNMFGQLGNQHGDDGDINNGMGPTVKKGGLTKEGAVVNELQEIRFLRNKGIVKIRSNGCHSVAIAADGAVFGWGRNDDFQLGDVSGMTSAAATSASAGTNGSNVVCPTLLLFGEARGVVVRDATLGDYFTLLLLANGSLLVSGCNKKNQLGLPPSPQVAGGAPVRGFVSLPYLLPRILSFSASGGFGHGHTVLITERGVYGAGSNDVSQLGKGEENSTTTTTAATLSSSTTTGGSTSLLELSSRGDSGLLEGFSPLRSINSLLMSHIGGGTSDLRVECGWRHTVIFDTKAPEEEVAEVFAVAQSGRFHSLPADAGDIILAYAGVGVPGGALNLALTCHFWYELLLRSEYWMASFKIAFPGSFSRLFNHQRVKTESQLDPDPNFWRFQLVEATLAKKKADAERSARADTIRKEREARMEGRAKEDEKKNPGFMSKWFDKMMLSIGAKKRAAGMIFCGLDAAGKTTILYRLKLGELATTIPTIGFNVERVTHKHIEMTIWDVGGPDKLRALWSHYYEANDGACFIVDSNDKDRMSQARDELHKMATHPLMQGKPILILANKQDLPTAMTTSEISGALNLHGLGKDADWFIQGCCARTGEGLFEGLDWITYAMGKSE